MRHWYTRYRISSALDDGALPAVLARGHAARCASCQDFARELQALDRRLTLAAPEAPRPVIVAPRARWPLVLAPLALAAAALVFALGTGTSDEPPPVAVIVTPTPAAPGAHGGMADLVSQAFVDASAPLDSELHDLIDDGRRGVAAVLASGGLHRGR